MDSRKWTVDSGATQILALKEANIVIVSLHIQHFDLHFDFDFKIDFHFAMPPTEAIPYLYTNGIHPCPSCSNNRRFK